MKKDSILYEDLLLYKDIFSSRNINIVSIGGVDKKHDKIFKKILSDEREMSIFLGDFLGLDVKENELEKYKNSFITKKYKNKESDMIYKQKGKNIYFLLEHQSKIDKEMPNRILSYCDELIEEVRKSKKKKDGKNPIIVPIVIYTGSEDWQTAVNFSETQVPITDEYTQYLIDLKYKLIDINNYNEKELLKQDTKFGIMMLMEKQNNSKEIKNSLINILTYTEDEERLEWIKEITLYILSEVLEPEEREEILNLIESKEESDMEEWIQRVKRNNEIEKQKLIKKGEEKGKKKGTQQILKILVKNMLLNKEDDAKILQYTNLNPKEYEKIKKELRLEN